MASSVLDRERIEIDEPMDWLKVRSVYRKLHTDFQALTSPFGIVIPDHLDRDLARLIGAIDVVDRELDQIDSASDRQLFGESLLRFLRNQSPALEFEPASDELISRMHGLRSMVVRKTIHAPFCKTVEKILGHTEAKRQANSQHQLISHLVAEWRMTGHLTVLVLGDKSTSEFESFFYLACEVMPAIDTIQDARMDYKAGQIRVRPGIGFYARLIGMFVLPLPKLLYRFPARWTLVKYAFSFGMSGFARRSGC